MSRRSKRSKRGTAEPRHVVLEFPSSDLDRRRYTCGISSRLAEVKQVHVTADHPDPLATMLGWHFDVQGRQRRSEEAPSRCEVLTGRLALL